MSYTANQTSSPPPPRPSMPPRVSYQNDDDRVKILQNQVNDVTTIMMENVEKVLDRDVKLNKLQYDAEKLADESKKFEKKSRAIKNKMWCDYCKSKMCLAIIIIIILLVIIAIIASVVKK